MKPSPALVLALTWLVAANLRTGFIGIGPVLPRLTDDLALSHTASSVLVALPTLLMGLFALPGGRLADRWGAARALALGLALVAAGGALRAATGSFGPLVAMTTLFGAGIGLAQPALPRLARAWFPGRMGTATGVYASGYVCGAIVGALLTGPVLVARLAPGSWRTPLVAWGIVALATLVVWLAALRPWRPDPSALSPGGAAEAEPAAWSPWRDRGAWLVALLFAVQGLAYYLLLAWLPAVYADLGLGEGGAAALFALFTVATLPGSLAAPLLSDRMGARRPATALGSILFLVGGAGLVAAPLAGGWRWAWVALAGFGVAAVFALTLVLPADLAPRGRTGATAGMVLGVGYAGSALGPVVAGAIRDATGSFETALLTLPVAGLVMVGLSLLVPELPRRTRVGAQTASLEQEAAVP